MHAFCYERTNFVSRRCEIQPKSTHSAHEGGEESVEDGNPSNQRACNGRHDNSMPRRLLPDKNRGGRQNSF
eukprot:3338061-Alexandrium_andersonii.AAC.1